MRIQELNIEIVEKYRNEIARFYYENMQLCSYMDHYSYKDAYDKIGDFIYHIHNNTCIGYGLFEEDVICGFIWAYPHKFREEDRMYVSEIRVKEEYRQQGYGKALLNKVERRAKELGISAVYIHAEADNPDAIRLYESSGFITERLQLRKEI